MKIRTLTLGSVAALAVAFLASPGFAQDNDTGPQYSTPAEHAQTQQLNDQVGTGVTTAPSVLNGQGGDPNQPSPSQVQYDQQKQQYDEKQKEYQDRQKRYEDQQEHYRAMHVQYETNLHHYDESRFYFTDYPHAYPYRYDDDRLVRLYMIAEPSQQLTGAPVEGPNGDWIGKVRSVETGVDGRPVHVEVALNRRVSVWVEPSDLRFDRDDHVVFTHLTRSDLWDMPGATYESSNTY